MKIDKENGTWVKEVQTHQTGGNVMVDTVILWDGRVLSITEDAVVLHNDIDTCWGDPEVAYNRDSVINLHDFPRIKMSPPCPSCGKVGHTVLQKNSWYYECCARDRPYDPKLDIWQFDHCSNCGADWEQVHAEGETVVMQCVSCLAMTVGFNYDYKKNKAQIVMVYKMGSFPEELNHFWDKNYKGEIPITPNG